MVSLITLGYHYKTPCILFILDEYEERVIRLLENFKTLKDAALHSSGFKFISTIYPTPKSLMVRCLGHMLENKKFGLRGINLTDNEFFQELKTKCKERNFVYAEIRKYILDQIKKDKMRIYYIDNLPKEGLALHILIIGETYFYGFIITQVLGDSRKCFIYKIEDLRHISEETTRYWVTLSLYFDRLEPFVFTEGPHSVDKLRDFTIGLREIWANSKGSIS